MGCLLKGTRISRVRAWTVPLKRFKEDGFDRLEKSRMALRDSLQGLLTKGNDSSFPVNRCVLGVKEASRVLVFREASCVGR